MNTAAENSEIKIAVLAHRGAGETMRVWAGTADYLTKKIAGYHFQIVPLDFHQIGPAVRDAKIDFVIANSSIYVELNMQYQINRIATMKKSGEKGAEKTRFGGVIVCRSDRHDIASLRDLKGKSFMAVEENSLGGWRAAAYEMKKQGFIFSQDLERLSFGGTHDKVVYAVRDGVVDAGTVRTDILESMNHKGAIDLKQFRILNQKHYPSFPYLVSTDLYPEWPFAVLRHVDEDLAEKVAVALMSMSGDSKAVKAPEIEGWTIPHDYRPVEVLMRELRIGPFREMGFRGLGDVIREHRYFLAWVIIAAVFLILSTLYVARLNRRLISSKRKIEESSKEIRDAYDKLSSLFGKVEAAKKEWEDTMDCVGDSILLTDGTGRIRRCNKTFMELIGIPYVEINGKEWKELLSEHGLRVDTISKENGELFHEPSGRWFFFKFYPLKSAVADTIYGTLITLSDFTGLKVASEALELTNKQIEKDRRQLSFALEEISSVIQQVVNEKNIKVRFRNPNLRKCYEVMGCGKKDCPSFGAGEGRCWKATGTFCGGHVQGFFAEKIGNCEECPVFKFATSDPIYRIGEHFNNMMHILESKNNELQEAYIELQTAQSHILQQEKMASIGQLAAGVAHEINNPIGFIMSNLSTLQKYAQRFLQFIEVQGEALAVVGSGRESIDAALGEVQEQRRVLKLDYIAGDVGSLVQESLEGAERVKRIVQDLKRFSRVDEAEYKTADINEGIESTINIVWNELKYKATMNKEYGAIPLTKCNPGQLNQVFMNLLMNAAQAIEKKGEITVKTWDEEGSICITISDTGCGIPADRVPRIFEPFFTTKEVGKGTGLGLSIAYDIIKKHKGTIGVQSTVGQGTAFTIKIPLVEG